VKHLTALITVSTLALTLAGCGGKSSTSPSSGSSGAPGPSGATITINLGGTLSLKTVSIAAGQSVTFVNNDNRSHDMASDPHPTHTQCPSTNALGVIAAGQTKLTNAYTTAATCGFHDHNDPENTSLQGTITIR
jgi:plastocyanin